MQWIRSPPVSGVQVRCPGIGRRTSRWQTCQTLESPPAGTLPAAGRDRRQTYANVHSWSSGTARRWYLSMYTNKDAGFHRVIHYSAKWSIATACHLSVTLVDQDHIGWKSWKLIARTISPTSSLFVAQRAKAIHLLPGEHGKLNDLECPIQLKVRMSHGLLADSVDTSLASLLYSNGCGAQWSARSVSEPRKTCVADALSLCGSWASCITI